MEAPAGLFSLHRLYNAMKSQGLRVSKDTLYEAMAHLEDAFLVFTVPLDTPSTARRSANPRKAYPIDTGLAAAHSFSTAKNIGHLLESVVYLELCRRGKCPPGPPLLQSPHRLGRA